MKGRYLLRDENRERKRERGRDLLRLSHSLFGPFGVNGHLSETDVSCAHRGWKGVCLPARTTVYRKEGRKEGGEEGGIKGGRLK